MHTHKGFRDGSTITIIIFQAGKVARWLRALVASAEDTGLGLNPHGFGSLNPQLSIIPVPGVLNSSPGFSLQ